MDNDKGHKLGRHQSGRSLQLNGPDHGFWKRASTKTESKVIPHLPTVIGTKTVISIRATSFSHLYQALIRLLQNPSKQI